MSKLTTINEALALAMAEKASRPVTPKKKEPGPMTIPTTGTPRNPVAVAAQQRKGGTMKNPKDKRVDGGSKNWRRHMDGKKGRPANVKEDARPPTGVGFGKPYGGTMYSSPEHGPMWMFRKGQKVRWFDSQGNQVGPELANVAPALAYAHSHGWKDPDMAGIGPIGGKHEGYAVYDPSTKAIFGVGDTADKARDDAWDKADSLKGMKTMSATSRLVDKVRQDGGRVTFVIKNGTIDLKEDLRFRRPTVEDAHAPKGVTFGQQFGPMHASSEYGPVWMFRRGQAVRWYDAQGHQIGPQHPTLTAATGYAQKNGWVEPRNGGSFPFISKEGQAPRFRRPVSEATKSFYDAGDEPDMNDFRQLGVGAKPKVGDTVWVKQPWEGNGRLRKGTITAVEFNGPVTVKIDMPGRSLHGKKEKVNPVDLFMKKG